MAEFCLACWNRINETSYSRTDVVLTHGGGLCEGCGQIRRLVARMRRPWSPLRYLPLKNMK